MLRSTRPSEGRISAICISLCEVVHWDRIMTIELEVSIQVETHPDGSSFVGIGDCGYVTRSIRLQKLTPGFNLTP